MRPQKVTDIKIISGLTKVFRAKGYDGASLKELSEATGLKKASLYHRFPNGKQQMASEVLTHSIKWIDESLLQMLSDDNNTPEIRLKKGLDHIRMVYDHGREVCILRALSMKTGLALFEDEVNEGMRLWVEAFKCLGLAFGLSKEKAEAYAMLSLIEIQGSLIVARTMQTIEVFENILNTIEQRYLKQ